jgi:hypothetical protein
MHEDVTFTLELKDKRENAFIFYRAEKIDKVETVIFFGFQSFQQNILNGHLHET